MTGGPVVVKAGDELGQEGDQRRPGQSAGRRRRDREPRRRPRTRSCAARRSTTTSSASPRRKSSRSTRSPTRLIDELKRKPVLWLDARQVKELEKVVLEGDHVNKNWVGKDAALIAKQIGISRPRPRPAPRDVRGRRAAPVRPARAADAGDPAVPRAGRRPRRSRRRVRVEHGFHHTATMHSTNIDNMAAMARVCNCSIFVKNDASYAGLGPRRRGLHVVHDRVARPARA